MGANGPSIVFRASNRQPADAHRNKGTVVVATLPTILSYGMGVESSAILVRWILSPETRPCPLEDLIVITSQVGDEYKDTGRAV